MTCLQKVANSPSFSETPPAASVLTFCFIQTKHVHSHTTAGSLGKQRRAHRNFQAGTNQLPGTTYNHSNTPATELTHALILTKVKEG